jgi:hypothetical protein
MHRQYGNVHIAIVDIIVNVVMSILYKVQLVADNKYRKFQFCIISEGCVGTDSVAIMVIVTGSIFDS